MTTPTTYSVYDFNRKTYDYYTGPGPGGTHAGSPHMWSSNALGSTPEQASWKLPAGAVKVGSGPMPKGRIATSGVDLGSAVPLLAVAVLAYVAWRNSR